MIMSASRRCVHKRRQLVTERRRQQCGNPRFVKLFTATTNDADRLSAFDERQFGSRPEHERTSASPSNFIVRWIGA